MNSQPDENELSPAHKFFNRPIRTDLLSVKLQLKPFNIKTAIESETQNRILTIKPGDTVRIKTDEKETCDKKRSVIAPNGCPSSYNVLNEKGNLMIRNCCHLIPANEKFIFKTKS